MEKPDNQILLIGDFVEFVDKLKEDSQISREENASVNSFLEANKVVRATKVNVHNALLHWHISMSGMTSQSRYFDNVTNLLLQLKERENNPLDYSQVVNELKAQIKNIQPASTDYSKYEDVIVGLAHDVELKLAVNSNVSPKLNNEEHLAMSVFFTYLFDGCSSLLRTVSAKKGDLISTPQGRDICQMWYSPSRSYIFPLNQGHNRPEKLAKEQMAIVNSVLANKLKEAKLSGEDIDIVYSPDFAKSIWIHFAIKAGIKESDIKSIIKDIPSSYSYINNFTEEPLSNERRMQILSNVARIIMPDNRKWFVMGLRDKTTPEIIDKVLSASDIKLPLYHPLTEITKRVGKKKKEAVKPFISHVLFFNCRNSEIGLIFKHILDYSWPYNISKSNSRQCAQVTDMERFQRQIGQLTPDVEITMATEEDLKKGDMVRITHGYYVDGKKIYEGEIEKLPNANRQEYVIRLFGDLAVKATANVPAYNLTRINH